MNFSTMQPSTCKKVATPEAFFAVTVDFCFIAPKWKPKSRPANGDSIIAKTDGSSVKLNCAAKGRPKPSISWYKNGQLFDHKLRPKVRKDSLAEINTFKPRCWEPPGHYLCRSEPGRLGCIISIQKGGNGDAYLVPCRNQSESDKKLLVSFYSLTLGFTEANLNMNSREIISMQQYFEVS